MTSSQGVTPLPIASRAAGGLVTVVGFLLCLEIASGVLQGYYTPILSDLADHLDVNDADLNWFESAQLIFAALIVPPLARVGDLVGHRRILLISTVITAIASWAIAFAPTFETMLVAWAVQGTYVIWLPLEVAMIYWRTSNSERQAVLTRRSAAVLVCTMEVAIIVSALTAGRLISHVPMTVVLAIPAVIVTLCLPAIRYGVRETPPLDHGSFDWRGLGWLASVIVLVMGGMAAIRLAGTGTWFAWVPLILGVCAVIPWWRAESASSNPLMDVRLLARSSQWRVQLVAFLFGMSILGGQVPLSTFSRTDPATAGFGLGLDASSTASRVGIYVLCLGAGALLLPLAVRVFGTYGAPIACCVFQGAGYALWLVNHEDLSVTMLWMAITGLGAGGLLAWIPVAAVSAAPSERVGSIASMTNAAKTMGGGIASSVFAICLASTSSVAGGNHASLQGYYAVWAICAASSLIAAIVLATGAQSGDAADQRA